MTASKSCPPGPTGRAARSPWRGLALPPLQSSGGSLHSRGSGRGVGGACAHDPGQALQSAAAPGRLLPNPRRARVVLATAAPRRSSSFLPRLGVVCVRVCECARARRHACAPPTHACSYLLAAAATGAMTAKDAASAGRHPARPHRGSASASAQKGYRWTGSREAARPPANRRTVLS